MREFHNILEQFAASGWDLLAVPAQNYLNGNCDKETLRAAIEQAQRECGNCGCSLDPLYPKALELLK